MHRQDQLEPSPVSLSLLHWYDRHRRTLPWRAAPGQRPDPYVVWLSEIMLQQTTVAAVAPYFCNFVTRWPTLAALAEAPLEDILQAWAGLGYYARARNLHRCASLLSKGRGGRFPATAEELEQLPGIGPYTASAIAAIAFDQPEAAVDGNVERVISRLYAIQRPLPEAKSEIKNLVRALVPLDRPGDFAQALMDLGATVCTPRSPGCNVCPLGFGCVASKSGIAETLPLKSARQRRPLRYGTAFWIERADGAVLLRRRPEKGLLGGMMEIPSSDWRAERSHGEDEAPLKASWNKHAGRIEHTFTHFHLILEIWKSSIIETGELLTDGHFRWVMPEDLSAEALPSVMRKIVAAVDSPKPLLERTVSS
ncbi:MAG TPA: A/G-specific adenine glycosylase [Aestuariivirgaceae bacterium]|jgi:A/G-specific adenine glycosylase